MGSSVRRTKSSGNLHESFKIHPVDNRECHVLIKPREIASKHSIKFIEYLTITIRKRFVAIMEHFHQYFFATNLIKTIL